MENFDLDFDFEALFDIQFPPQNTTSTFDDTTNNIINLKKRIILTDELLGKFRETLLENEKLKRDQLKYVDELQKCRQTLVIHLTNDNDWQKKYTQLHEILLKKEKDLDLQINAVAARDSVARQYISLIKEKDEEINKLKDDIKTLKSNSSNDKAELQKLKRKYNAALKRCDKVKGVLEKVQTCKSCLKLINSVKRGRKCLKIEADVDLKIFSPESSVPASVCSIDTGFDSNFSDSDSELDDCQKKIGKKLVLEKKYLNTPFGNECQTTGHEKICEKLCEESTSLELNKCVEFITLGEANENKTIVLSENTLCPNIASGDRHSADKYVQTHIVKYVDSYVQVRCDVLSSSTQTSSQESKERCGKDCNEVLSKCTQTPAIVKLDSDTQFSSKLVNDNFQLFHSEELQCNASCQTQKEQPVLKCDIGCQSDVLCPLVSSEVLYDMTFNYNSNQSDVNSNAPPLSVSSLNQCETTDTEELPSEFDELQLLHAVPSLLSPFPPSPLAEESVSSLDMDDRADGNEIEGLNFSPLRSSVLCTDTATQTDEDSHCSCHQIKKKSLDAAVQCECSKEGTSYSIATNGINRMLHKKYTMKSRKEISEGRDEWTLIKDIAHCSCHQIKKNVCDAAVQCGSSEVESLTSIIANGTKQIPFNKYAMKQRKEINDGREEMTLLPESTPVIFCKKLLRWLISVQGKESIKKLVEDLCGESSSESLTEENPRKVQLEKNLLDTSNHYSHDKKWNDLESSAVTSIKPIVVEMKRDVMGKTPVKVFNVTCKQEIKDTSIVSCNLFNGKKLQKRKGSKWLFHQPKRNSWEEDGRCIPCAPLLCSKGNKRTKLYVKKRKLVSGYLPDVSHTSSGSFTVSSTPELNTKEEQLQLKYTHSLPSYTAPEQNYVIQSAENAIFDFNTPSNITSLTKPLSKEKIGNSFNYSHSLPSQSPPLITPLQPPPLVTPLQPPQLVTPLQPPQLVTPLQPPQLVTPLQQSPCIGGIVDRDEYSITIHPSSSNQSILITKPFKKVDSPTLLSGLSDLSPQIISEAKNIHVEDSSQSLCSKPLNQHFKSNDKPEFYFKNDSDPSQRYSKADNDVTDVNPASSHDKPIVPSQKSQPYLVQQQYGLSKSDFGTKNSKQTNPIALPFSSSSEDSLHSCATLILKRPDDLNEISNSNFPFSISQLSDSSDSDECIPVKIKKNITPSWLDQSFDSDVEENNINVSSTKNEPGISEHKENSLEEFASACTQNRLPDLSKKEESDIMNIFSLSDGSDSESNNESIHLSSTFADKCIDINLVLVKDMESSGNCSHDNILEDKCYKSVTEALSLESMKSPSHDSCEFEEEKNQQRNIISQESHEKLQIFSELSSRCIDKNLEKLNENYSDGNQINVIDISKLHKDADVIPEELCMNTFSVNNSTSNMNTLLSSNENPMEDDDYPMEDKSLTEASSLESMKIPSHSFFEFEKKENQQRDIISRESHEKIQSSSELSSRCIDKNLEKLNENYNVGDQLTVNDNTKLHKDAVLTLLSSNDYPMEDKCNKSLTEALSLKSMKSPFHRSCEFEKKKNQQRNIISQESHGTLQISSKLSSTYMDKNLQKLNENFSDGDQITVTDDNKFHKDCDVIPEELCVDTFSVNNSASNMNASSHLSLENHIKKTKRTSNPKEVISYRPEKLESPPRETRSYRKRCQNSIKKIVKVTPPSEMKAIARKEMIKEMANELMIRKKTKDSDFGYKKILSSEALAKKKVQKLFPASDNVDDLPFRRQGLSGRRKFSIKTCASSKSSQSSSVESQESIVHDITEEQNRNDSVPDCKQKKRSIGACEDSKPVDNSELLSKETCKPFHQPPVKKSKLQIMKKQYMRHIKLIQSLDIDGTEPIPMIQRTVRKVMLEEPRKSKNTCVMNRLPSPVDLALDMALSDSDESIKEKNERSETDLNKDEERVPGNEERVHSDGESKILKSSEVLDLSKSNKDYQTTENIGSLSDESNSTYVKGQAVRELTNYVSVVNADSSSRMSCDSIIAQNPDSETTPENLDRQNQNDCRNCENIQCENSCVVIESPLSPPVSSSCELNLVHLPLTIPLNPVQAIRCEHSIEDDARNFQNLQCKTQSEDESSELESNQKTNNENLLEKSSSSDSVDSSIKTKLRSWNKVIPVQKRSGKLQDGYILQDYILNHYSHQPTKKKKLRKLRADKSNKKNKIESLLNIFLDGEFTENTLTETLEGCKNTVKKDCTMIVKCIVRQCKYSSNENIDFSHSFPLNSTQQRLFTLVIKLEDYYPSIVNDVLQRIEFVVCNIDHHRYVSTLFCLSRFFTAFCKFHNYKHRAQIFCYDALYCLKVRAHAIVFAVLSTFPECFPKADSAAAGSAIVQAIVYVIYNYGNAAYTYTKNLRAYLSSYYCYKREKMPNEESLLQHFINDGMKPEVEQALLLLAKFKYNWAWTHKHLIKGCLLQTVDSWRKGHASEKTAAWCIKLCGYLAKTPPYEKPDIPPLMTVFENLLYSDTSPAVVKEACVFSFVAMFIINVKKVVEVLKNCKSERYLQNSDLKDILNRAMKARNPNWWSKYLTT